MNEQELQVTKGDFVGSA
ncbi:DUF3948 family protein, partial [Bacillus sp. AFS054943]